ncbi:hypothetical protein R50071_30660 [Halioxenophilus aromaticivorans]
MGVTVLGVARYDDARGKAFSVGRRFGWRGQRAAQKQKKPYNPPTDSDNGYNYASTFTSTSGGGQSAERLFH